MINASAAKYGTISITASGWIIPNTGPITTPSTIKKAMSGIPVFLKNASPNTPKIITTLAANKSIGADAINEPVPPENSATTFWTFAIPCERKSLLIWPVSTASIGLCSKNERTSSFAFEPLTCSVLNFDQITSSKNDWMSSKIPKKIQFMLKYANTMLI